MQKSKAGLFLMELLIALLFFAITGAVCLSLFVGAHNTNVLSENTAHASVLLTNYSETFYRSDFVMNDSTLYYDDTLKVCERSSASYCVSAKTDYSNGYFKVHITITDPEKKSIFLTQDLLKYERRQLKDVR